MRVKFSYRRFGPEMVLGLVGKQAELQNMRMIKDEFIHYTFIFSEVCFTNAQSCLLAPRNVYQMRLYVAHQSYQ